MLLLCRCVGLGSQQCPARQVQRQVTLHGDVHAVLPCRAARSREQFEKTAQVVLAGDRPARFDHEHGIVVVVTEYGIDITTIEGGIEIGNRLFHGIHVHVHS